MGYFAKEYTPTYRGFDTFYGYYNGAEDYFYHNRSGYHFPQYSGVDLNHARYKQSRVNSSSLINEFALTEHVCLVYCCSITIDLLFSSPNSHSCFTY